MEVISLNNLLQYQIATKAVNSLLFPDKGTDDALDLSFKAPFARAVPADNSTLESSQLETSFSNANSFHKDEVSSSNSEDSSSAEGKYEVNNQFKLLMPDLHKHFELHCKIGSGTFASVYLASLRTDHSQQFAIKHLVPTCHPKRVKREALYLKGIGGYDGTENVCGIKACIRNKGNVAFILPYLKHVKLQDIIFDMDCEETKLYMKNLLIALKRVHQFNVIHRDVKPGNFLYDREAKKFMLVDFGLAQYMMPQAVERQKNLVDEPSKKRKADVENALSPNKKLCSPTKRAVLQAQLDTCKNIISGQPAAPKVASPLFQSLMRAKTTKFSKQSIASNSDTSFVRVKNSRIKMMSAPLLPGSRLSTTNALPPLKCPCHMKTQLCEVCLNRKKQLHAPRGGTPGYRPPEVLLKTMQQTTAVDIWAAGVCFLSILSGSYPFFRSPDDMTALSEIATLFGTKAITDVALKLDRVFVCDKERPPLDLQKLCCTLRKNRVNGIDVKDTSQLPKRSKTLCDKCSPSLETSLRELPCLCPYYGANPKADAFTSEAYDLLRKMLDPNPATRITAEEALQHPFLADGCTN
ncbi:cell division cycle 7-related protein kinase-like [Cloeon dipterum]|uniref:cell division cycle 7-related protein kinase-like n=1 Tax=Cloeon dipterum TaxID=197152 RepID=UPI0032207B5C